MRHFSKELREASVLTTRPSRVQPSWILYLQQSSPHSPRRHPTASSSDSLNLSAGWSCVPRPSFSARKPTPLAIPATAAPVPYIHLITLERFNVPLSPGLLLPARPCEGPRQIRRPVLLNDVLQTVRHWGGSSNMSYYALIYALAPQHSLGKIHLW
jgi:hypothetical protein